MSPNIKDIDNKEEAELIFEIVCSLHTKRI